jgi:hypothetical protein
MQKIMIAIVAILAVVAFSGCTKKTSPVSEVKTPQAKQATEASVISSANAIQEAMRSGEKTKCVYTITDKDGQVSQSEIFVDGDKYKSITNTNNGVFRAIFDGKATYAWSEGSKNGSKMEMSCMEEVSFSDNGMSEENQDNPSVPDPTADFKNAVDVNCEKVDSIDLTLPSDVDFVDQCEMLKKQKQQLQQLQQNMPQGAVPVPEGVVQE